MPEVLYFCFAKSTFSGFSGFHILSQTKRENYNGYHSPYSADLTFESKDDGVVENNGGCVFIEKRGSPCLSFCRFLQCLINCVANAHRR